MSLRSSSPAPLAGKRAAALAMGADFVVDASRQVRPDDFITGTFPLERTADAFEAATGGEHIKVLIDVS